MPNDSKTVVLIADDEPSTVAMLSSHLRSKGFTVLEASDGDQAWELAHEHLPHLVLLDVMMPGMSGWEVCRKIREAVSLAHTGVIMLTGIGENLNEMTSPLYGADAHLDKPFDFGDLDREIDATLARRRAGALGRADGDEEDPEGLVRKTLRAVTGSAPKAKAKPAAVIKLRDSEAKPSLAKTTAKPATGVKKAAKKAPAAPAKKAPAAPAKKAPAAPAKKAPAAPAKKAPVKAPVKKAPVKQAKPAPAKKAAPKKALAKKAPAAPAKKAPAKQVKPAPAKPQAKKPAAAKAPPAPAKKAPTKKAPAKKAPAKQAKPAPGKPPAKKAKR